MTYRTYCCRWVRLNHSGFSDGLSAENDAVLELLIEFISNGPDLYGNSVGMVNSMSPFHRIFVYLKLTSSLYSSVSTSHSKLPTDKSLPASQSSLLHPSTMQASRMSSVRSVHHSSSYNFCGVCAASYSFSELFLDLVARCCGSPPIDS